MVAMRTNVSRAPLNQLRRRQEDLVAIRLDRVESIPRELALDLDKHRGLFQQCMYLDEILGDPVVLEVARALQEYAENAGILAFHYTRALPEKLRADGLTICSGNERREQFMNEFGDRFTDDQRRRIRRLWSQYFDEAQNRARDGRVFFCGSDNLKIVGSVGYLHQYYGGEAVNMPLTNESDIMAVLAQIGRPLVVCCSLDSARIRPPYDNDCGRALISAYHIVTNHDAEWAGYSTFQAGPVLPGQILEIHEILEDGSLHRL